MFNNEESFSDFESKRSKKLFLYISGRIPVRLRDKSISTANTNKVTRNKAGKQNLCHKAFVIMIHVYEYPVLHRKSVDSASPQKLYLSTPYPKVDFDKPRN